MPDSDILDGGYNRELENLQIALRSSFARTAITLEEFISIQLNNGVSPEVLEAALLRDLNEGGRIFRELRSSLKSTAHGSINAFRDIGQLSESGVDKSYTWVAVLVKTCPDCMSRHGKKKLWQEWEAKGLPRRADTVCRHNCRCVLVQSEDVNIEPIVRKRGR